ncbi:MAG: ABC transporter permease [Bacteroidales bacterium]|jgi:putative ABC transport system permease protein|nr:ABC transporter permease [Bacteroidales bacterium]
MIKNYLLTAFRNILRHKGFSFINILGLSLSMSVCMLIIVVIVDQYKYDDFITKKNQIYRIESIDNVSKYALKTYASTAYPLHKELTSNYAVVEDAVIINNWFGGTGLYNETRIPINGFYTNESFFNLFDFELTSNSFKNPLKEPYSMVLKEETVKKYFGDENPIGKFLQVDSLGDFKITGIIPKTKNKSQFQFQALVSSNTIDVLEKNNKINNISDNWENAYSNYIYILVNKNTNLKNIQTVLDKISLEKYSKLEEIDYSFYLKPFNKIVPGAFIGNEIGMFLPKIFIIFLGGLSLVIIISAAFNYTSLSMARSLLRAKEVGVRKTLGASRGSIIFQFLSEAILVAFFALIFAFVLFQLILPGFSGMKLMSMLEISPEQNFTVYLWFFIFAVLTGFLSGILPSIYISSFNPIKVLKGVSNIKLLSKITLRKILLVTQFVFSMVFIISIILIYNQMNYMINAEMGIDRDFVYNVKLQKNDFNKVKNYYTQFPEIKEISGASHVPGVGRINDTDIRLNQEDEKLSAHYFSVDQNYIDVMGLELLKGKNFPDNLNAEMESFVIIDERTLSTLNLGDPGEAIGKNIIIDSSFVEIIGVVKNYHYVALFLPQRPLILRYLPENYKIAALRIDGGISPSIIAKIENEWKNIDEFSEFNGEFLDTEIKDFYSYFEDIIYIVGFTSILAIVIACLGLLGMATYSTQTRTKEIGIRKVYGAEVKNIVMLISKSYIKMFIIAAIIAGPIAYFINNAWVQYIANHAPFGFGTIFIGIFIIISFGMITIASQTLKAANLDPAKSLRYE